MLKELNSIYFLWIMVIALPVAATLQIACSGGETPGGFCDNASTALARADRAGEVAAVRLAEAEIALRLCALEDCRPFQEAVDAAQAWVTRARAVISSAKVAVCYWCQRQCAAAPGDLRPIEGIRQEADALLEEMSDRP